MVLTIFFDDETDGAHQSEVKDIPAPDITSISTDSGSSSSDQITTDTTISLSGTATANATVTLYRADVGKLGDTTANGSGDWTYDYTSTTLAEGVHAFDATQTVSGNVSDRSDLFQVRVDSTDPDVTLTIDSSTYDFSPEVRVVATGLVGIDANETVTIDVDLDNDGNFTDPGETGHSTGTCAGPNSGRSRCQINPVLILAC